MNRMPPVAIIGLGLIGGSLAAALQQRHVPLLGYSREEKTTENSLPTTHDFPGTLYPSLKELLLAAQKQSAMVIIATPYNALPDIFSHIAQYTQNITISDVTSVKTPIMEIAATHNLSHRFIGGHPMAGTQDSGWQARDPHLFRHKKWVLTGNPNSEQSSTLEHMIRTIGAEPIWIDAQEHDQAVAAISHLPHILAEILATQGDRAGKIALQLAASSFADGTRVAHTRVELVHAMLLHNRTPLIELIDSTINELHTYKKALLEHTPGEHHKDDTQKETDELFRLLTTGHTARMNYEKIQTQHND